MALGLTQPLTEMCTRNISWGGKGGWCIRLTLPPSCVDYIEIWEPQPLGTLMACNGTALPFNDVIGSTKDLNSRTITDLQTVGRVTCKYNSASKNSVVQLQVSKQFNEYCELMRLLITERCTAFCCSKTTSIVKLTVSHLFCQHLTHHPLPVHSIN